MEETLVQKRPREAQVEKDLEFEENSKRHKPYNHIISLLDSEEEDPTEDLSTLMTTLQQEITCSSNNQDTLLKCGNDQDNLTASSANLEDSSTSNYCSTPPHVLKEEEESDQERVMRHLFQASDDELGIPNTSEGLMDFGEGLDSGDGFSSLCDKLWELEDQTANYYALLQSELFLWGH